MFGTLGPSPPTLFVETGATISRTGHVCFGSNMGEVTTLALTDPLTTTWHSLTVQKQVWRSVPSPVTQSLLLLLFFFFMFTQFRMMTEMFVKNVINECSSLYMVKAETSIWWYKGICYFIFVCSLLCFIYFCDVCFFVQLPTAKSDLRSIDMTGYSRY